MNQTETLPRLRSSKPLERVRSVQSIDAVSGTASGAPAEAIIGVLGVDSHWRQPKRNALVYNEIKAIKSCFFP
jgi:hypothetical protein